MVGFPGAGDFGDFVDAGSAEAVLEEHLPRRIKNSFLDLALKSARRTAGAPRDELRDAAPAGPVTAMRVPLDP